ncbi:hypothetical protein M409DRAFT_48900 [Zasmidium cellare ATCC 36951]|uniref:Uncharacterized protein n=1 Tax=Zasmidium cellare ATCC 36951 TaxID=1080233 RepID=A0A6A6D4E4_ZASCE|nr:uncharacterized protein M409DRAFT_48900 [Zasmidium cellare ATCC 36951]KAF2174003.1 hypothetical protein M409DRAFT_48900 [Zasmidium cellare ATCC 36951]
MPASFLDLAAELRNEIYHEALTHDRENGRTATVALLRTCRQIHSEAQGILHSQSIFLISVSPVECRHQASTMISATSSLKFSGDCLDLPHYRTTTSERELRALPSASLRVPAVKVQIHVADKSPRGRTEQLNQPIHRFIAALWRHMNSDNRDRRVDITLINKTAYAGNTSSAIEHFSGLVFLGPHVKLTMHQFDKTAVDYVESLRKGMLDSSEGTIRDTE